MMCLPCINIIPRFTLSLENLVNRPFLTRNQGKPGIVRELCIIFIQVRNKSGKMNHLVHISYKSSLSMVARELVVLFVINKCELCHFA